MKTDVYCTSIAQILIGLKEGVKAGIHTLRNDMDQHPIIY